MAEEVERLYKVELSIERQDEEDRMYPPELWYPAAKLVLALERKERGNPDWVPTLLNGSVDFGKRVRKIMLELKNKQQKNGL